MILSLSKILFLNTNILVTILVASFNTIFDTSLKLSQIEECKNNTEYNTIQEITCSKNTSRILKEIVFKKNSASISPAARDFLDTLVDPLYEHTNLVFEIAAYTDSQGPQKWNMRLSQKRADTIRLYLIFRGVRASQLIAIGYGENDPVAANTSKEGRYKNRRIVLRQKNNNQD